MLRCLASSVTTSSPVYFHWQRMATVRKSESLSAKAIQRFCSDASIRMGLKENRSHRFEPLILFSVQVRFPLCAKLLLTKVHGRTSDGADQYLHRASSEHILKSFRFSLFHRGRLLCFLSAMGE